MGTPAEPLAYAKLFGKFSNKDQSPHDFTRYVDNLPCVLGRSKERKKEVRGGYVHIGDSKTISREAARIDYDKQLSGFTLCVTGKSSVLVDGRQYTKEDPPVLLRNESAIRIGGGVAQGMSRFYFLLPLDKPPRKLNDLFLMVAKELDRAGLFKVSGRAVANALRDKYPYYGAEEQFKTLPRRAVAFMTKKKDLFEKSGQQGRTNLFRYIGEGAKSVGASGSSSSSSGGGSNSGADLDGESESKVTAKKMGSGKRERSASQAGAGGDSSQTGEANGSAAKKRRTE